MSTIQTLRAFLNQRLTAAVEEIFGLLETTISNYEEEIDRQRRLLEDVFKSGTHINTADIQDVFVRKEEQHEWSTGLDQQDPELPHIKEEEEQLSQEGKQLQGLEDRHVTKFPFTAVCAKSEDYGEKAQTSQLHQTQTEESKGAGTPACSTAQQVETETDSQTDAQTSQLHQTQTEESKVAQQMETETDCSHQLLSSYCSESETEDTREQDSGSETLNSKHTLNYNKSHTHDRPFGCTVCGKRFGSKGNLNTHMRSHTGEKPFTCTVCNKSFSTKVNLQTHMRSHTGEKPFSCTLCNKSYSQKKTLVIHFRSHTGERPFSCSFCGKRFSEQGALKRHFRVHAREKAYSCSVCGRNFLLSSDVKSHKCTGVSSNK